MPKRSLQREIDLNLLAPMDALLTTQSVSAAAAALKVSQPTMSGMLARLRVQFGDELLVRVGKQFELTAYARLLAPEIHQILLRIQHLNKRQPEFDPQKSVRHFRMMTSEIGLTMILPRLLPRIYSVAPRITLEVVPIQQPLASVYAGQVDLSITGDFLSDASGDMANQVRVQALTRDVYVALVDHHHPLSDPTTREELALYPHVSVQFPGSQITVSDIPLIDFSQRNPPRLKVGSFLAAGRLVAGTDAFTLIPRRMARLAAKLDDLRIVSLPEDAAPNIMRLLWHRRYDQDPEHRWLRSIIARTCSELQSDDET